LAAAHAVTALSTAAAAVMVEATVTLMVILVEVVTKPAIRL